VTVPAEVQGRFRRPRFIAWCTPASGPSPPESVAASLPDGTVQELSGGGWSLRIATSGAARTGTDPSGRVTVLLQGETFDATESDPAAIAELYLLHGDDFPNYMTGTFGLLALDRAEGRLFAVTDLPRSRRMYVSRVDGSYCITNDLLTQPTHRFKLDPVAIGWILANKAVFMGRTLFDGVQILRRTAIHDLRVDGIESNEYWDYSPGVPDHSGVDPDRCSTELEALLETALRRVTRDEPDIFLSLSGGYDSRGIACFLGDRLGVSGVRAISYTPDADSPMEEIERAGWTAARLGFEHRVLAGFTGDLMRHMRVNAEWGESMSRVCDELDAWLEQSAAFADVAHPVMLAGDMNFGLGDPDPQDREELVRAARFRSLELPLGLERVLPAATLQTLNDGIWSDFDQMLARTEGLESLHAKRAYVTFDQRMSNTAMPWRERFAGRFAAVRNPWLDADLVKYMSRVPYALRYDRRLFKDTLGRLFPTEFAHGRVQGSTQPNLRAAFQASAPEVRRWIRKSTSRLDDLIPPDFGLRLLDAETKVLGLARQRTRRIRDRIRVRALGNVQTKSPRPGPLPAAEVLRRWAVLRMALERPGNG